MSKKKSDKKSTAKQRDGAKEIKCSEFADELIKAL